MSLQRPEMEDAHAGRKRALLPVKKSEPVLVHPANRTAGTAGGFYYLSNLDQNLAVIMKTVHLYRADERAGSAAAASAVLKDALAKVLAYFHPFAGSLAMSPEGKLVVSCTGGGVPFVEAVADCDMDAVGVDVSMAVPAALECLVHTDPRAKNLLEMPLLAVQVTSFRCGGFVLGMAVNHCLADGMSAVGFLRTWAETARGLPLSCPPFLDRSLLRPRRPPKAEFPHPEFADVEDVSGMADLYLREAMSYRSFTFDAPTLALLKRAAQGEDAAAAGLFSSFTVLVALVWRARNAALGMAPAQKTKLLFPVDVRGRLDPPLPPGYFGNGIVFPCCLCEAGELAARPLSSAAAMVRDAARGVTDRFVRSAIDYFEVTRAKPLLTGTLMVTTWTRLGFEKVDFGWGEAAQMCSVELPTREVAVLLPPRVEAGGVELVLGLPVSAMEAFEDLVKVQCCGEPKG